MKTIDFETDIKHVLYYYKHLQIEQDKVGEEMEDITKDILSKKSEEDKIDVDDFIDLEIKSFMINLYQQEIIKAGISAKNLYRMSLNACVNIVLDDDNKAVLNQIIEGSDFDFAMFVNPTTGQIEFKDETVKEGISFMCRSRVNPSSLEDRFEALKSQYEAFIKIRESHEGKKADA